MIFCAVWLFARKLPKRDGFGVRVGIISAPSFAFTIISILKGFSLYPPITTTWSFVKASCSFVCIIALEVVVILALWDTSTETALYCASSAYTLQNTAMSIDRIIHVGVLMQAGLVGSTFWDVVSVLCAWAVSFTCCEKLLASRFNQEGLQRVGNHSIALTLIAAILINIIFDLIIKDLAVYEIPWRYVVVISVIHLSICVGLLAAQYELLYNRQLHSDIQTMENVLSERQHQYEISRETIAAVNARMHDMRHLVLQDLTSDEASHVSRETLATVARQMEVYDHVLHTGNEALDTILSEKGLLCHRRKITLTCIADGTALGSMSAADIYTLFGTILQGAIDDNEVQAGTGVEADRRSISLVVKQAMGMVSIHEEHWRTREVASDEEARLQYLRMEQIVEYYGGTITARAERGAAQMDIMLPL